MAFSNEIMNYLRQKARATRSPITVNMELLPVCNLDCKMCYIRSTWKEVECKGGLIDRQKWIEMAKQLQEAGVLFLLLTGGEIFLYPEFKELYIELYKMGFVLTINTNATMIDESTVDWLKKYPPKCVSISLYGASDETYFELCGRKNMFTRLDKVLHLLKENNINVELKSMLTPLNYKDIKAMSEYAIKMDIPFESAVYAFPPVRKENKDFEQMRFNAKQASKYTIEINRLLSEDDDIYYQNIEAKVKEYEDSKDVPGRIVKGFSCSACNTACWINWKGRMISCAMIDEPYTLPFEVGFVEAWEELKQKIDEITLSTTCSFCEKRQFCTVCPASSYTETGDIGGTSAFHCEMTDDLLERMYRELEKKEK